jgi:hypothetical protein
VTARLKDTRRILFPPSDRKSYVPPEKQPDNRNRNVYELLQTDDDTDSEPADPLTERMELPFRNTELFMTLIVSGIPFRLELSGIDSLLTYTSAWTSSTLFFWTCAVE